MKSKTARYLVVIISSIMTILCLLLFKVILHNQSLPTELIFVYILLAGLFESFNLALSPYFTLFDSLENYNIQSITFNSFKISISSVILSSVYFFFSRGWPVFSNAGFPISRLILILTPFVFSLFCFLIHSLSIIYFQKYYQC